MFGERTWNAQKEQKHQKSLKRFMSPNVLLAKSTFVRCVSLNLVSWVRRRMPMYAKSIRLFFRHSFHRSSHAVSSRSKILSSLAYWKTKCTSSLLLLPIFALEKNPCCHSLAFVRRQRFRLLHLPLVSFTMSSLLASMAVEWRKGGHTGKETGKTMNHTREKC